MLNTFTVAKLFGLKTTRVFNEFHQIQFQTVHHFVQRETDSYKSHDFFLNPIMFLLYNVYLYITVNGNRNKYV